MREKALFGSGALREFDTPVNDWIRYRCGGLNQQALLWIPFHRLAVRAGRGKQRAKTEKTGKDPDITGEVQRHGRRAGCGHRARECWGEVVRVK